MRINVHSGGFQLTPQLRGVVVSRLLSALGPFSAHIESVVVDLQVSAGATQPDTMICDVVVKLRPSGDVRARAEDAKMPVAIDRAARDTRIAVEREVSRVHEVPDAFRGVRVGAEALEIVLDENRISQLQRKLMERPANYLRPVRVREYWRPPGVEDNEAPTDWTTSWPRHGDSFAPNL
jgi:ribosome-associated translation inhibitor RaiA